jgi:A/G-specific adenine glycosylase
MCAGVLTGVGAYTGNAIASIACSERVAVVDANVVRILARLRCMVGNPRAAAKEHAALAEALLDPDRPGDFNQVQHAAVAVCKRSPAHHECLIDSTLARSAMSYSLM